MPSGIPSWPREAAFLIAETALRDPASYAVGGAVRDLLLGREIHDLDIASFEAETLSKKIARHLKAKLIVLDDENIVFRMILNSNYKIVRQIDIAQIQGKTIEEDLSRRDFTINAMALSVNGGDLIDPRGGRKDLERKTLRSESEEILRDDPLRILRAFRIAAQLDFKIDQATLQKIKKTRKFIDQPAGERIQSELMALLEIPGSSIWLKVMDEIGALTALFKELGPCRKTAVEYYGKGGVLNHCLETAARADFLLSHLNEVFPMHDQSVQKRLDAEAQKPSQRALIVLAALLHDISKPETARFVKGRLHFFGHDSIGSQKAVRVLEKLRFSKEQISVVKAATLHHLRAGYLAEAPMITERAVYRFFRDVKDHAIPVLLASWADHASYLPAKRIPSVLPLCSKNVGQGLASLKPIALRKTVKHLQTVSFLMRRFLDLEKKVVPNPLINGNDVMKILKIVPGPVVGKILEKMREAQATGKIKTREDALIFLKRKQKTF